jgi:hypothetical protein
MFCSRIFRSKEVGKLQEFEHNGDVFLLEPLALGGGGIFVIASRRMLHDSQVPEKERGSRAKSERVSRIKLMHITFHHTHKLIPANRKGVIALCPS